MFPPQWLLTRYLHFVVAVTSEEMVTGWWEGRKQGNM